MSSAAVTVISRPIAKNARSSLVVGAGLRADELDEPPVAAAHGVADDRIVARRVGVQLAEQHVAVGDQLVYLAPSP